MGEAASVFLPFREQLEATTILERPNRFILRCLDSDGVEVRAHLPNSGRLTGALEVGGRAWLSRSHNLNRSTNATAHLVETRSGVRVGVDTSLPNQLVHLALQGPGFAELEGFELVRREYTVGASRIDFLLSGRNRRLLLEVKSVSWVEDGAGLFPDAVSARGARHLRELGTAVCQGEYLAAVCFVVQRTDAKWVAPARSVDVEFGRAFDEARAAGVQFMARACHLDPGGVALTHALPVTD